MNAKSSYHELIHKAFKQNSHVLFVSEKRYDNKLDDILSEIETFVNQHDCMLKGIDHCHGIFSISDKPLFAECAFEKECESPNGIHTWTLVTTTND